MALSILKRLLQEYEQSLFDEGVLDERFSQIEEPNHVVQMLTTYFNIVEMSLSEFNGDSVDIDSSTLSVLAQRIEEESTRIGANHVRLASVHLIQACDQRDQKIISQALSWIKNEFSITRNKLEPIIQMEQRIMRLQGKQE